MYRLFCYEMNVSGQWEMTHHTDNKDTILKGLVYDLMSRYVWKSCPVYRVTDNNNYDGTRTIRVYRRYGDRHFLYEYF